MYTHSSIDTIIAILRLKTFILIFLYMIELYSVGIIYIFSVLLLIMCIYLSHIKTASCKSIYMTC